MCGHFQQNTRTESAMPRRHRWIVLAVALLAVVPLAPAADALPDGARLRLGTTDMRTVNALSVALSPDGQWVAYRSAVDTVRIVEALTRKEVRVLTIKDQGLGVQLDFSGDGKCLVFFNHFDVTLLDAVTGAKVGGFSGTGERKYVRYALAGDGALGATTIAETPAPVKLWDAKTGVARGEIRPCQNGPIVFSLAASGKVLATTGRHVLKDGATERLDNVVEVWDTAAQKPIQRLDIGASSARVQLSADGKWVALLLSQHNRLEVWDIPAAKKTATITENLGNYPAVYFSPDSQRFAVASDDGRIGVYSVADGKRIVASHVPCRRVAGVAFPAAGPVVAAGVYGPTLFGASAQAVMAWTVPGNAPPVPSGHVGNVNLLRFTADSKQLITVGSDDRVVRWDVAAGKELGVVLDRFSPIHPPLYALSPDATLFVTRTPGKIRVVDLATGKNVNTFNQGPPRDYIVWEKVLFAADGKTLFGLGWCDDKGGEKVNKPYAAVVSAWNSATGKSAGMRRELIERNFYAPGVCAQLLKDHFAAQLAGDKQAEAQAPVATVGTTIFDPWVSKNDFGSIPVGMRVVVQQPPAAKPLLEAATGCCCRDAAAVSPDGKWLAVGWNDTTVMLYDLAAAKK